MQILVSTLYVEIIPEGRGSVGGEDKRENI